MELIDFYPVLHEAPPILLSIGLACAGLLLVVGTAAAIYTIIDQLFKNRA